LYPVGAGGINYQTASTSSELNRNVIGLEKIIKDI
jgi:hypothetical protein